jgi:poly-gamma-glutamate capsule biosynthesis protein CapA/YwtB (metallophosphatase superfamily)
MGNRRIVISAVGDVVLARDDPKSAFDAVLPLLQDSDFRICNLEVPLSNRGLPQYGKHETLRSSPAMVKGYVHAGFDAVSLANNHTMDYGPAALLETIALLDENDIAYAGAGPNRASAWAPLICDVNNSTVGVVSFASEGFLGYAANSARAGIAMIRRDPLFGEGSVSSDDVGAMRETIKQAKRESERVLACFHWGLSQSTTVSVSQSFLARAAIEAGADAVIGHHPHVLQGVEIYRGSPILYSVGNFVFDLRPPFFGPWTDASVVARLYLEPGRPVGVELVPIWIGTDGCPRPLSHDDPKCSEILQALQRMSEKLGTSVEAAGGVAKVAVT